MTTNDTQDQLTNPTKGDFVASPSNDIVDEQVHALPDQEEFWRPPTRFGSVPIEKEPLGWDRRKGYRKLFPSASLPIQIADRVSFGHSELEPNRLFWGDNLHVMRQLPSGSLDLIYIDPPFFSGRQYNVLFGDQNELRSFSDIWEGGMPGYLIWLGARLYEMKRLLKESGSIYVHCDWHASHYIKVEMDKIFGHDRFLNEIVWSYTSGGVSKNWFGRKHDVLLLYAKKHGSHYLHLPEEKSFTKTLPEPHTNSGKGLGVMRDDVCELCEVGSPGQKFRMVTMRDVWTDIRSLFRNDAEMIGYPTQKPERLLQRIIESSCPEDGIVADFFCGGGTTASVAQRTGRRWITCDQSRVAVAITTDRLIRQVEDQTGKLFEVPDFTVEHWGVYEAERLSDAPPEQFRAFVLRCFGARDENEDDGIHGYKGAVPIWVGRPELDSATTASDVQTFANSVRKTLRYRQDNLRDGIMLSWAFRPDATEAAERLRRQEQTDLNFIRLDMVRINSPRFREHVSVLSTNHADYENFLTFVQPPKVEVGFKRLTACTDKFDASDSIVLNLGARIINVQWDFGFSGRFSSTPGFSFVRGKQKEPAMQAQYQFPSRGKQLIACRVQDDLGGDGLWTSEIEVT